MRTEYYKVRKDVKPIYFGNNLVKTQRGRDDQLKRVIRAVKYEATTILKYVKYLWVSLKDFRRVFCCKFHA